MSDDAFGTSIESTLGPADGTSLELRDRITSALRYTFSWASAVGDVGGPLAVVDAAAGITQPIASVGFLSRIHDMQTALRGLLSLIPADSVFPGNDAVSAYETTSQAFAQLYRDLALSRTTLPHPELLEQLGALGSGFLDAPAAAITAVAETASNAIARALGGTAAAIWSALWPYLLVAAGVGVIYLFRAPLGRVLAKVST